MNSCKVQPKYQAETSKPPRKRKCNDKRCLRHALNIKTKCCRYKCDKALKKKLKSYRVRLNGEADPEVLDVSRILISSLKINSPTKLLKSPSKLSEFEIFRPTNYLFKMARRKIQQKSESPVKSKIPNMFIKTSIQCSKPSVKDFSATDISNVSQELSEGDSQEKKQTNAFKLLMESRNKSIGSNSPGKEKKMDTSELEELVEKKKIKAKRNLVLQKLADAKGAVKNKALEEYQEKCIQKKMEKRAETLKKLISNANKKPKLKKNLLKKNGSGKSSFKEIKLSHDSESDIEIVEVLNSKVDSKHQEHTKKVKSLHLVDIFQEIVKPKINPDEKPIPKEDEEFIKKLSPSIKKKENMLSYFQKVEKNKESIPDTEDSKEGSPIIKVKVSLKGKKKIKKRKLSLNKDICNEVLREHNENSVSNNDSSKTMNGKILNIEHEKETAKETKNKTKEESSKHKIQKANTADSMESKDPRDRPKRKVKRPIKYMDDVDLSSSDDELLIFTPKKRRHVDKKLEPKASKLADNVILSEDDSDKKADKNPRKNRKKDDKIENKSAKLAPIFVPKPLLNAEQLEAKQKFLYSGVPDQIKKIQTQQKLCSTEFKNEFPMVVHIQQSSGCVVKSPDIINPLTIDEDEDDELSIENCEHFFKQLIDSTHRENNIILAQKHNNTTTTLQKIKEMYPKFPVYRTFKLLKNKSKGELKEFSTTDLDTSTEPIICMTDASHENPDYLNWTDKYKATSSKHVIGNFEPIKEMRRWLTSWTENEFRSKNTTANESDSSDFCYDSDSNSKDYMKGMKNLLVLVGPSGCGKTSSVYAVAAELSIKVIEVNASSKRTGKVMLQDLQEATQSHKVNRGNTDNSQKSQEVDELPVLKTYKKRGRPKKTEVPLKKCNSKDSLKANQLSQSSFNEEVARPGMSLILVDDADIVFDQDDGFSSAIGLLVQSSKRPVILVTSSGTCPHLQKFIQYGKLINMSPLLPRMLGTWLDLLCLADNGTCFPGLGAQFLNYFKGDIRKTMNSLQFHMNSHKKEGIQDETILPTPDDEDSNISWNNNDAVESKHCNHMTAKDDIWKYFMKVQTNLHLVEYPQQLFNIWWSIPRLFKEMYGSNLQLEGNKEKAKIDNDKSINELQALANVMNNFSVSDCLSSSMKSDNISNLTSQPWFSSESDSVSEIENDCVYDRSHEINNDIIKELVINSICETQRMLACEEHTSVEPPTMAKDRERERKIRRHDYLTDISHPSVALDRRALALDYWSTCRSICRIEKNKSDVGSKRNNRFCHYLKSMNPAARNETFDSLAESLNCIGME